MRSIVPSIIYALVAIAALLNVIDGLPCLERPMPILSPYHERIAATSLIDTNDVSVVVRLEDGDPLRYFSVFDMKAIGYNGDIWLTAKSGDYPHCKSRSKTVLYADCDDRLKGKNQISCLLSKSHVIHNDPSIDHNLGLLVEGESISAVGGYMSLDGKQENSNTKVWALGSPTSVKKVFDRGLRKIDDVHGMDWNKGCVEFRTRYLRNCNFDGRFSMVRPRDSSKNLFSRLRTAKNPVLLYARANLHPKGGGRHVTVGLLNLKNSTAHSSSGLISQINVIRFLTTRSQKGKNIFTSVLGNRHAAIARANIYFACVNRNPVDDETLVGMFPVVVRETTGKDGNETAAILLAISLDGVYFSPPIILIKSFGVKGEIMDHPVDGLILRGENIHFYVQHGVPGTLRFICEVRDLLTLAEHNKGNSSVKSQFQEYFKIAPKSEIVRYSLRVDAFRRYTNHAKILLRSHGEKRISEGSLASASSLTFRAKKAIGKTEKGMTKTLRDKKKVSSTRKASLPSTKFIKAHNEKTLGMKT